VGLSYLLCRVLDTVEDAQWLRSHDQLAQFDDFNSFLKTMPNSSAVAQWASRFPSGLPEGEQSLLQDTHELFEDLHQAPDSVRGVISSMVTKMSFGMRHFALQRQLVHNDGRLRLKSLAEVNQYCYFVAGVVGEALAQLVAQIEPQFQLAKGRLIDAHHFGLFLQKVNILKDQNVDATEGRDFLFDRREVLNSMSVDVFGAARFLHSIPLRQREFRLFCGWSLFLGLASIPFIESQFAVGLVGKLSREEAEEIFSEVQRVIDDPDQVEQLFQQLLKVASLKSISEADYERLSFRYEVTHSLPVEPVFGV
jgi:hypothetical protein